jgi:hypothetical protein
MEEENPALTMEPLNPGAMLQEAAEPFQAMAEFNGKELTTKADGDMRITGNRASVERLMSTMLDNAVKYTPEGGRILAEAVREGKYAVIQDGERSELSDVLTGNFPDTVPFLREDRNSNPGIAFGTLLAMNSQEFDEERARRLCNVLLRLDAPLRFFEPLPSKFDFR